MAQGQIPVLRGDGSQRTRREIAFGLGERADRNRMTIADASCHVEGYLLTGSERGKSEHCASNESPEHGGGR